MGAPYEDADLHHPNHHVRLQAIARASRALKATPGDALADALEPRLVDPHLEVRDAAARVLGDQAAGSPETLARLVAWSAQGDAQARDGRRMQTAALSGLARAGRVATMRGASLEAPRWESAREVARAALGASVADLRYQGVLALLRLGAPDTATLAQVREALDDRDDEVAVLAAELLAQQGDREALARMEPLSRQVSGELRSRVVLAQGELVASCGVEGAARDAVVAALVREAGRLPYGIKACEVLGEVGGAGAREPLGRLAGSWWAHRLINVAAAAALARLGDASGTARVLKALGHRKPDARGLAMEWAGRLRLEGGLERLVTALEDPRDGQSDTAAVALGMWGGEVAVEALFRASRDARPEVRVEVAHGLARAADDVSARDAIAQALERLAQEDPDPDVQHAAQAALERVTRAP